MDLNTITRAIEVGLRILSTRIQALVALCATTGLFGWAMFLQTWMALAIAAAFAVTVFLPVLTTARRKPEVSSNEELA
jgi:hypothetical protein